MFNFVIGKRLVNAFLKGSKMSDFQAFLPHFHAKSKSFKIHSPASSPTSGAIPVIMAMRIHLFPFRTQKLSSSTAKVLDHPRSGRIASCRISIKNDRFQAENGHFSFILARFRFSQFVQFLLVLI